MAYSKPVKVIQDFGAGLQTWNRLGDNLTNLINQLAVQHGTDEFQPQLAPPGFGGHGGGQILQHQLGHHDRDEVPKAVCTCSFNTGLLGSTNGNIVFQWSSGGIITGVSPVSSSFSIAGGSWFIGVSGLQNFWAHAVPWQTTPGDAIIPPQCWSSFTSPVGVYVQTYNNAGPGNQAFFLTLYGSF